MPPAAPIPLSVTISPGAAATQASPPLGDLYPALDAYPHVSRCPYCRAYAAGLLADLPEDSDLPLRAAVSATLAHHDSGHCFDPLLVASQHFAALG